MLRTNLVSIFLLNSVGYLAGKRIELAYIFTINEKYLDGNKLRLHKITKDNSLNCKIVFT